ncbi:His-Xaa-Ser system protein HxsD [Nitrosospira multiformis]|uniref:His-Xaa-Ser system protein HxsD n=1 Tax=Nitrosospira multiformis TaxID=1231 RepID=A0A2T5HXD1_9PROT|nr:His-Xaa-Ser system protein HxsD [Nitrosospira multiformis]PTQ76235.1 His-Xaa-Ser system protein HxsD [Nitrosospira multiformis]
MDLYFDSNVFSLETIKRALYRFADLCSFEIQLVEKQIRVTLYVPIAADPLKMDDLCYRIRNEVLDQDLRDTISKETANIRTLILANAFSNTGLIES